MEIFKHVLELRGKHNIRNILDVLTNRTNYMQVQGISNLIIKILFMQVHPNFAYILI